MMTFFYSLSLLFIWVECVQFKKKPIIYTSDISQKYNTTYFIFFISKIINMISIPIGIFTPFWKFYALIMFLESLKFLVLFTKKNYFINLYNLFTVIAYILIYGIIFVQGALL